MYFFKYYICVLYIYKYFIIYIIKANIHLKHLLTDTVENRRVRYLYHADIVIKRDFVKFISR